MNQSITLDIIDRAGWQKELPLERTIVHIGSDPRSDIVLDPTRGAGVAPLHAQLIAANSGLGYQLVNLGDVDILLGPSGDQVLPPRSVTRLGDGMVFKLGEFTLVFHCGGEESSVGFTGESRYIGLKLSLPQVRLGPKRSLEGKVTVSNLGDRSGAQFNLEFEGLEPDCFDIEPGPILSAGATKEVTFHLYHRGDQPLAGDRRITIHAVAPHAYPGEEAAVTQVVEILPLYRHSLRLLSPDRVEPSPRVEERPAAVKAVPPPAVKVEPSPQAEDWWKASPAPATEQKPRAQVVALPPAAVAKPAAEAKPPVTERPTPVVPAVTLVPVSEAAPPVPAAEPTLSAEIAPPASAGESALSAEVTPPPAAETAPVAEVVPPPSAAEMMPPAEVPAEAARPAPTIEQVPQVEPAAAPPKKGWARLIEAIPFFRPKPAALPADAAGPAAQPQAATPPTTVEAGAMPATEGPPHVEVSPAVEGTGGAEARIVEERGTLETGLQPLSQPISEEPPAVVPEVTPQVEEEQPPQAKVVSEESPKKRRALKLKASPPPETKEVWAPPVEAGPAPAEDWWTPQVSPEEAAETQQVLKLKASLPSGERAEPAPVEVGPPPAAEDWWTAEASSKETSATRPVLKLKAGPSPESEPKPAAVEAGVPPAAEDWWTAEAEADAEMPAEKRQVLKLKASPPSETGTEEAPAEAGPPSAEDWWTP